MQVKATFLSHDTELRQYSNWSASAGGFVDDSALTGWYRGVLGDYTSSADDVSRMASERLGVWDTPIFRSATYGIGNDNPLDSYSLTQQQGARSVMVLFENLTAFQVRLSKSYN